MRNRSERGSFTMEEILSLSIFMFAFVTIVSLATIAKVKSTTQFAIDQVAKEISHYYYIAERVGFANTDSSGVDEIDGAVQAIFDFTVKSSTVASNYSSTTATDLGSMLDTFSGVGNLIANEDGTSIILKLNDIDEDKTIEVDFQQNPPASMTNFTFTKDKDYLLRIDNNGTYIYKKGTTVVFSVNDTDWEGMILSIPKDKGKIEKKGD